MVSASKGIENDSLKRMTEVLADVLGEDQPLAVLSGPSFAAEVARGVPTAVTVASRDESVAATARDAFAAPRFRVYTSTDVVGVELGGAVKNVIAIATGIADGLRLRRQRARRRSSRAGWRRSRGWGPPWAASSSPSWGWPAWVTWC